jgi:hypothetical protein
MLVLGICGLDKGCIHSMQFMSRRTVTWTRNKPALKVPKGSDQNQQHTQITLQPYGRPECKLASTTVSVTMSKLFSIFSSAKSTILRYIPNSLHKHSLSQSHASTSVSCGKTPFSEETPQVKASTTLEAGFPRVTTPLVVEQVSNL